MTLELLGQAGNMARRALEQAQAHLQGAKTALCSHANVKPACESVVRLADATSAKASASMESYNGMPLVARATASIAGATVLFTGASKMRQAAVREVPELEFAKVVLGELRHLQGAIENLDRALEELEAARVVHRKKDGGGNQEVAKAKYDEAVGKVDICLGAFNHALEVASEKVQKEAHDLPDTPAMLVGGGLASTAEVEVEPLPSRWDKFKMDLEAWSILQQGKKEGKAKASNFQGVSTESAGNRVSTLRDGVQAGVAAYKKTYPSTLGEKARSTALNVGAAATASLGVATLVKGGAMELAQEGWTGTQNLVSKAFSFVTGR
jgi:hypothetical protein